MENRKKKIVFVNSVIGNGSTGKICVDLANKYIKKGYDVKIAYGRGNCDDKYKKYAIKIGNNLDVYWHVLMTRLFDKHGLCSINATKKFIKWLDEYRPDELWLHNIHGYYINYEILFNWIKKQEKLKVKWTLHDCWAFTGHCSYYTYNKCYKWKKECKECNYFKDYPKCIFFENSKDNFSRKRNSFLDVKNLEIITPSFWLKDEVKKSFLKNYDVKVLHNTIDTKIFKPTKSNLRKKLGLKNKFVILAVANVWEKRKGLDDILKLSKKLDDRFVIFIVGVNKKQLNKIKKSYNNIITLLNILNKKELVKLYSRSDVFINPSYEETYGMTNAEAILCNTKTISYNQTALNESLDEKSGIAIKPGVKNLYKAIIKVSKQQTTNNKQQTTNGKIILINKTENRYELAKLYSMADVFINPTYEDNYPTVNLEARACGTKVITYDVGGCEETVNILKRNYN